MKSALKLDVQVGDDHLVKLPDDVPVGPAEIIVLLEDRPTGELLEDFEPVEPAMPIELSKLVIEDRS
jgi:hypothetical protein